jgi:hypothetical protein
MVRVLKMSTKLELVKVVRGHYLMNIDIWPDMWPFRLR